VIDERAILVTCMSHQQRRSMEAWGLHGVGHWWRVRHNGLLIAAQTGADERVVRLFSLFHDAFREDDGYDEAHGVRAADWLLAVRSGDESVHDPACAASRGAIGSLDDASFARLETACRLHTTARFHEDPTVATCFVADRLDLSRVGVMPDRRYLPVAQEVVTDEIIVAAVNRSSVVMPGDLVEAMERAWGVRPGGA
jgi:uncharacterized protein